MMRVFARSSKRRPDGRRNSAGQEPPVVELPLVFDGTLALFSNSDEFFCQARVIGKVVSELASERLWGSPEFRWLIFLTDVNDVSVPLRVVREGAGFAATYRINRQAIVPKRHREDGLWEAIADRVVTPRQDRVELVPPEGVVTEAFEVSGTEPHEGRRTEAELVKALRDWWTRRDGPEAVWRLSIQPAGTGARLYADLFNKVTGELVEAKADADRNSVRMAIGQLADYRRFVDQEVVCKVLLPTEPINDLVDLLKREGIGILLPDDEAFRDLSE